MGTYIKFLLRVNKAILRMALQFFFYYYYYMTENSYKENKMFLLYFLLRDIFKMYSASHYYNTTQGKKEHTAEIWHSNFYSYQLS